MPVVFLTSIHSVFQVGCPEEMELSLFVQVTTAELNPLEMNTAVVTYTCTNKDNSHLLDNQLEIHCTHENTIVPSLKTSLGKYQVLLSIRTNQGILIIHGCPGNQKLRPSCHYIYTTLFSSLGNISQQN